MRLSRRRIGSPERMRPMRYAQGLSSSIIFRVSVWMLQSGKVRCFLFAQEGAFASSRWMA